MPTKDVLISLKFNNYNYAPGIATYGIDGKIGNTGLDGNNIYFTDFNIQNSDDLSQLANLLKSNYLPLKGSKVEISRSYKDNDMFFDQNGIIYRIDHLDNLINGSEIGQYTNYFKIAGKINVENSSNYFAKCGDRLILNSSIFGGYDVVVGIYPEDADSYIDKNSAVNIISNVVDENDNIEMVKMQSIDDIDIEDGNLSVYYKTTENAYYLDSNKPIVINGDVKVNPTNIETDYDNFSTVLTSSDTITYFKHICDKLNYSIIYDSDINRYKISIYQKDGGTDALNYLINRNETVFGKIYTANNELVLFKLNDIIFGKVNSSIYEEHMPTNDINDLNPSIETSDFRINFINVNNSSIYTNAEYNQYNKSYSVDVSLNVSLEPKVIAHGKATSSNTLNRIVGLSELNGVKSTEENVEPKGLVFNAPITPLVKNYIEIQPSEQILAGDKLEVVMYLTKVNNTDTFATVYVDGISKSTSEVSLAQSSDKNGPHNTGTVTYEFNNDADTSILIGVPDSKFRICEYKIIKGNSSIPSGRTAKYYEEELLENVFALKISYKRCDVELRSINTDGDFVMDLPYVNTIILYGEPGRYSYTFNTNYIYEDPDKKILLSIIPTTEYEGNNPIQITLSIPNDLSGTYTLYFTIEKSNSLYSIKNIMLDDKEPLVINDDIEASCIQTTIPDVVDSVKKLSLLHNTEIFIPFA